MSGSNEQKKGDGWKHFWRLLQVVIGIAAMAFLLSKIDLQKFLVAIREANWLWFVPALIAPMFVHLWTFLSMAYLVEVLKRKIGHMWLFRVTLLTQAMGMVAPGKLGDLSIIWFFKRRDMSFGEGFAIAVYSKVVALAVTSWIGLLAVLSKFGDTRLIAAGIVVPALAMVGWMLLNGWLPASIINKVLRGKLEAGLKSFLDAWKIFGSPKVIGISVIIAETKAVLMALVPYFLFISLGHPVSLPVAIAISSAVRLLGMIPLSPSGLGIRELSGTVMFTQFAGAPEQIAANVMIMTTLVQYTIAGLCYFSTLDLFSGKKPADIAVIPPSA